MSDLVLIPSNEAIPAPPLSVERWFNAKPGFALSDLKGSVVVLHAFQMLCPGCVSHGLPQAQRIQRAFDPNGSGDFPAPSRKKVVVVGLHTVFEHHEAMRPVSLEAFLHEYRVTFPVAVDQHEAGHDAPITMRRYGMRGTPTLILIDGNGLIRGHVFGRPDDLRVGARVASLVAELEMNADDENARAPSALAGSCTGDVCRV